MAVPGLPKLSHPWRVPLNWPSSYVMNFQSERRPLRKLGGDSAVTRQFYNAVQPQ